MPGGVAALVLATAVAALNLLVVATPFSPTGAVLSQTQAVGANTLSTATCFPNWMYVWDVTLTKKTKGANTDVRATVTVREDTDTDCVAAATDSLLGQAGVTVELRDSGGGLVGTDSGNTKGNGTFTTGWFPSLADDTYGGWVTSLTHATGSWNPTLDVVNPGTVTIP